MIIDQQRQRQVANFFLIGIGLAGIGFFAPDTGQHPGAFFKMALHSSWRNFFDLVPAWCSLKVILFSVGLFMVFDALGIVFVRAKLKTLGLFIFSLEAVSFFLLVAGLYGLVQALL